MQNSVVMQFINQLISCTRFTTWLTTIVLKNTGKDEGE